MGLWCLMPLSTIFQLYCGGQFDWWRKPKKITEPNHICGAMVSVLASSTEDHGFEPLSGRTEDYKIVICCFSAKHAPLKTGCLRIRIMCRLRTVVSVS